MRFALAVPEDCPEELQEEMAKSLADILRASDYGQRKLFADADVEHHSVHQHRDVHTGRFADAVPHQQRLWAADMASDRQAAYTQRMQDIVAQQRAGEPTARASWYAKRQLRSAYTDLFALGREAAGNPTPPTLDDHKALEALIRDQYRYVDGFLEAVSRSEGRLDYGDRAHMHGMHGRVAYWLGWVRGHMAPNRAIRWVMHPDKEHCEDCLGMAQHGDLGAGLWTPRALLSTGLLPHSGHLACRGYHCGCELDDVTGGVESAAVPTAAPAPAWAAQPRPLHFAAAGVGG